MSRVWVAMATVCSLGVQVYPGLHPHQMPMSKNTI